MLKVGPAREILPNNHSGLENPVRKPVEVGKFFQETSPARKILSSIMAIKILSITYVVGHVVGYVAKHRSPCSVCQKHSRPLVLGRSVYELSFFEITEVFMQHVACRLYIFVAAMECSFTHCFPTLRSSRFIINYCA